MAACRPLKEYGIAGGGSGKQGVPVYYGKQRGRGYVPKESHPNFQP